LFKVALSDQGEGWPQDAPTIVTGEVEAANGVYAQVRFDEPLDLQRECGEPATAWRLASYAGAWIAPRLAGDSISPTRSVPVHLWLVESDGGWGDPPVEAPDFWAECTVLA
jgi:hypothetical protein